MIAPWVVVIVGYVIVMICNFTAVQAVAMMADQLNTEKPRKDFLSPFGWNPAAWQRQRRIVREYRAAHPDGHLYRRMVASYAIGAIALAVLLATFLKI
jgi:hypothetical protein